VRCLRSFRLLACHPNLVTPGFLIVVIARHLGAWLATFVEAIAVCSALRDLWLHLRTLVIAMLQILGPMFLGSKTRFQRFLEAAQRFEIVGKYDDSSTVTVELVVNNLCSYAAKVR
jgi:hypothetical protein